MRRETLRGMQHCTKSGKKKEKKISQISLSLNIKPLKPFQLWIQNKKNRELVQPFDAIFNWCTLNTLMMSIQLSSINEFHGLSINQFNLVVLQFKHLLDIYWWVNREFVLAVGIRKECHKKTCWSRQIWLRILSVPVNLPYSSIKPQNTVLSV